MMKRKNRQDFSLLSNSEDENSSRIKGDTSSSSTDSDEDFQVKQCLEPFVDTSEQHSQPREYRFLWYLAIATAVIMGAAIIVLQVSDSGNKSTSNVSNNKDNNQYPQTMVPTTTTTPMEGQDKGQHYLVNSSSTEYPTPAPMDDVSNATTATIFPSALPTNGTSVPLATNASDYLTMIPTGHPNTTTGQPTTAPVTSTPSENPSTHPTESPTKVPTENPTLKPSKMPTLGPSLPPSMYPIHLSPTNAPTPAVLYRPGNLTTTKLGLLLSEGLDVRLIAETGSKVAYVNGKQSKEKFHGQPDAGETFVDTRPENPGGWIYVSNSEMAEVRAGGVGALTFNKDGNIIDYSMVLEGTSMNCGGGRTPWNTWVSCEGKSMQQFQKC